MKTIGQLLTVRYRTWIPDAPTPAGKVWKLDDGRVRAVYDDGETIIFPHTGAFLDRHAGEIPQCQDGDLVEVEAPPIPAAYSVEVDWAEVHHLVAEIQRARWGTRIGYDGVTDALGGGLIPYLYGDHDLAQLIALVSAANRLARDAWNQVHASGQRRDVSDARAGCRVAVAVSRLLAALHRAGLIEDPSSRICGTGPGYGLSGLGWLDGSPQDRRWTTAEVQAFAETGKLPAK